MKILKTLFLLIIFCFVPMVVEAATEYKIDDVSRKLYPRPEWYIKLTTEDGNWTFCYDILTDEIVPGKVYTIEEMLASDCQAYDNVERESHKFVTATYCETYDEKGTLMIEATATTTDGMDIILRLEAADTESAALLTVEWPTGDTHGYRYKLPCVFDPEALTFTYEDGQKDYWIELVPGSVSEAIMAIRLSGNFSVQEDGTLVWDASGNIPESNCRFTLR